ncbi:ABC transporter permease subunit [Candidatus Sumerlaeota bacterium]|nr:ABC transporter permease subunit [Candidatus Sumerlaeota bacterium]
MISITPILKRELIAQLRQPRSFLYLFLYLGAITCFSVPFWYEWQNPSPSLFGWTDRAEISRSLFLMCSCAQIIMVGLLAATTGSAQISSERRRMTLDLLLTTPLRHSEIILGKAMASVGLVLLIAIAAIPIYSLCFITGGVGWKEVALMIYLTLLTGVTYSMIGVGCSALPGSKRTKQSQIGVFVIILLNGAIPVIMYLAAWALKLPELEEIGLIAGMVCSPFGVFYAHTSPSGAVARGAPMAGLPLVVAHTVVEVAVFFVFLLLGCRWIHKYRDRAVARAEPAPVTIGEQPRRRTFGGLFPVQDWLNPVTAKDLLLAIPRRRIVQLLLLVGSIALFALGVWLIVESPSIIRDSGEARAAYDITVLIAIFTAALVSYFRAAGVVASEAEAGTLPLLAITPLESERILRGKLGAVLLAVAGPIAILGALLTAVYCLFHLRVMFHVMWAGPLAVVAVIIASALAGSLSLLITVGAQTVRAAQTRATLLLVGLLFFGPCGTGCIVGYFLQPIHDLLGDRGAMWFALAAYGIALPGLPLFVPTSDGSGLPAIIRLIVFAFDTAISIWLARLFLRWASITFARRVALDQEKATKA